MSDDDESERHWDHSASASSEHSLSLSSANHLTSPLLLGDSGNSSSHRLSHIIHTRLDNTSSPLLDVTPAVRSLIWQYMDNRSSLRYLSTCHQLHTLYHSFPLHEPIKEAQFTSIITRVRGSPRRMSSCGKCGIWLLVWFILNLVVLPISIILPFGSLATAYSILLACLLLPCAVPIWWCFRWSLLPERSHCCDEGTRLTRHTRPLSVPRVIRLAGKCSAKDLPWLQHVEELQSFEWLGKSSLAASMPSSLRVLSLHLPDSRAVKLDTLPAKLTVLVLIDADGAVMQRNMLPKSLVTLTVRYKRTLLKQQNRNTLTAAIRPMAAGVLPSQLQWLAIDWPRSLADLALPASLSKLELRYLSDLPIPPRSLPPHLHTLRIITSYFNPNHLRGALPSSLRVLRLHCQLTALLTGEVLQQAPQLEELDLGEQYNHRLTADTLAPLAQLCVLRVGSQLPRIRRISPHVLPLSLHRLIIVGSYREEVDEQVPQAVRHEGLVVDFEEAGSSHRVQHVADLFNESRVMVDQALQRAKDETAQSGQCRY